jgi:predicted phage terminase large subunit-like protein
MATRAKKDDVPRTPAKKCSRCGTKRQQHVGIGVCVDCERKERRRNDPTHQRAIRNSVASYRARKKLAGEVDKSHGIDRTRAQLGLPPLPKPAPEPPRPVEPPPPPADRILAKDTSAPLSKNERRQLTVAEAAQIEFARRELARRKLIYFVKRRNPKYIAGWVHDDICARLDKFSQDVRDGKSPRLMLFMPPRHGKSMLCSQEFPAHHLGNNPDHQIISTSYAETLALDFSRKVQEIIETEDFELLFEDCRLKPDARSIERWNTTKDGAYTAAGVGGPITGRGAHVLIIDDPVKNFEEADSPKRRLEVKNWYTSTAYNRLMPGGGILIIQTRWHDDDLSGWLITMMQEAEKQFLQSGEWPEDADRWEIVKYPAVATVDERYRKAGEALHSARYPLSALLKIKRTSGSRDWNALYQQEPVPDTGEYFTKDMLRYYDGAPPTGLAVLTAGDLAISKADYANYTVFLTAGVDEKDDLYLVDGRRGKWDSNEIIDELIDVYRTWKPQLVGIEKTHVEQSIGPFLEKRICEEKLYSMAVEPLPPGNRDKQLRAQPIRGRMKQGKVYLPRNAPFVEWLVNELLRFPASPHDDGVDALAWLGQMLNMVKYTPPPKTKTQSWKDRLIGLAAQATPLGRHPAMAA